MEIIAHRGASFDAPENTLASVRKAWEQGADAVEADFQLTRDGKLIALHDDDFLRTHGARVRADELTLGNLPGLDVGFRNGERWREARISSLAELLATTPPGKRFFIELKAGEAAVAELIRVANSFRWPQRHEALTPDQIVIISLDRATCAAVKRMRPEYKVYWVVDFHRDAQSGEWSPGGDEIIAAALADRLDGLDLMATGPIDAPLANKILAAKLDLCVWTVDDPALARRLLDLGVQGLTTNRPGWLREQLAKLP